MHIHITEKEYLYVLALELVLLHVCIFSNKHYIARNFLKNHNFLHWFLIHKRIINANIIKISYQRCCYIEKNNIKELIDSPQAVMEIQNIRMC